MTVFHDLTATTAQGETRSLSDYKGHVLLIVNVASKCGFTPQYEGLEQLYQSYKDQGLRILAFPSNDYGAQEPGTIEEVREFCKVNYGVTFDLFDKVHAKGADQHPVYQFLTANAPETGDVQWNFEKFLLARDGRIIGRFGSRVAPMDGELTTAIEQALAVK
ncbi:glutathione peroxidase [Tumebacillus sp. BK434]|uniref:glutathione peroxidase n=1 Tax=Tumebacillus sp. BK434 TaxID=2512169 RepID=UPI001042B42E|nr:glutathione peroxidase [Tumebacillus sp. BK434]TCP55867.1 glutathione peroxidase [Tumebacillus sp. BK434]